MSSVKADRLAPTNGSRGADSQTGTPASDGQPAGTDKLIDDLLRELDKTGGVEGEFSSEDFMAMLESLNKQGPDANQG
jgi:hypothetical protein